MGKHDKQTATASSTTHDEDDKQQVPHTPQPKRRHVGDIVATASRRPAKVLEVHENDAGMVTYTISYLSRRTGKAHPTRHERSGYRLLDYHMLAATKLPNQGTPQQYTKKADKAEKENTSKEVGENSERVAQIAEGPEELAMHLEVVAEREKEEEEAEAEKEHEEHKPEEHKPEEHAPEEHAPEEHKPEEHAPEEHKSEGQSEAHEHIASELGIATSGIGAITSGISGVTGLIAFAKNVKQFDHSKSASERYMLTTKAMANLAKGGAGIIGAGSRGGRTAGSIASLVVNNDALKAAMNAFSAVGGTVDFIAGAFATIRDGSKTVLTIGKALTSKDEHTNWKDVGPPMVKTLEDVVRTLGAGLTAANGIVQLAHASASLAAAMPAVGAGINIFLQVLNLGRELVRAVQRTIKLVRLMMTKRKMEKLAASATDAKEIEMYQMLATVNHKRFNRQLMLVISEQAIPMAMSVVSIAGSVLEIVGVATSAAYGAGVALMGAGAGMRGGAALVSFGSKMVPHLASGIRKQKQFGRDVASGEKTGKLARAYKAVHLDRAFNKDKSTEKKQEAYLDVIDTLFTHIRALPAYEEGKPDVAKRYKETETIVAATGVKPKELYAERDQDKAIELLLTAMKKRD